MAFPVVGNGDAMGGAREPGSGAAQRVEARALGKGQRPGKGRWRAAGGRRAQCPLSHTKKVHTAHVCPVSTSVTERAQPQGRSGAGAGT